jgi:CPA2 family monovalent cation:H+ antiporter-2
MTTNHFFAGNQQRLLVSTRGIVSIAMHENPNLYIITRTRYLAEVDDLKVLGSDEVIPAEFGTSIEIFSRTLQKYNFPKSMILAWWIRLE